MVTVKMGAREILETAGHPKICTYCGIKEDDFTKVWGPFYAGKRGKRLEPDHKDNNKKDNNIGNLCWACSLCNCAKTDKLTHEEMKDVGAVIRRIWRKRAGLADK
ncbi:MAG: HNH endonuclease [Syntrophales bacterium]|nr:HNH endonuclease [Syntrophales bacterium]